MQQNLQSLTVPTPHFPSAPIQVEVKMSAEKELLLLRAVQQLAGPTAVLLYEDYSSMFSQTVCLPPSAKAREVHQPL